MSRSHGSPHRSGVFGDEMPKSLRKHRSPSRKSLSPGQKSPSEKDLEKYYKSDWYKVLGKEVDELNSYKGRVLFKNGTDTADLMEIDKDETLPYFSKAKPYIKHIPSILHADGLPVFELSVRGTLDPVYDDEYMALDPAQRSAHKYYVFSKLPEKNTHMNP